MDSTDMANHRRREVDWIAYLTLLKPITWFPPMWAMACGLISAGLTPQMAPGQFLLGIILAGPLLCGASQIATLMPLINPRDRYPLGARPVDPLIGSHGFGRFSH